MFTKKPEREMGGDPLTKMSDRPASETTPFGERSPGYVKSPGPSKLVPSIIGEDLMITGNVTSKSRGTCNAARSCSVTSRRSPAACSLRMSWCAAGCSAR